MAIWWLKACPRCRGDLLEDMDYDEDRVVVCFQCGRRLKPEDEAALRREARWRKPFRVLQEVGAERKAA